MLNLSSVLLVPVIIGITTGSVILISKLGGKSASKIIRYMNGVDDEKKDEKKD